VPGSAGVKKLSSITVTCTPGDCSAIPYSPGNSIS